MLCTRQGTFVLVTAQPDDVAAFNRQWPCSNIPDYSTILFELDTRNGDLVNLTLHNDTGAYVDNEVYDGPAILALSHDATNFAVNAGLLPQWARK